MNACVCVGYPSVDDECRLLIMKIESRLLTPERLERRKLTYLIKTMVLRVIRNAIRIPNTIARDNEVPVLFSIDGSDNKRDEQRASIDNRFGGGPRANMGGGGGNCEQR